MATGAWHLWQRGLLYDIASLAQGALVPFDPSLSFAPPFALLAPAIPSILHPRPVRVALGSSPPAAGIA